MQAFCKKKKKCCLGRKNKRLNSIDKDYLMHELLQEDYSHAASPCFLRNILKSGIKNHYWYILFTKNNIPALLLFNHYVMSDPLRPHGLQHARLLCPSLYPGVCSDSSPLSQWCYIIISSSAAHLLLPSIFPASGSFPMSQDFASGGQTPVYHYIKPCPSDNQEPRWKEAKLSRGSQSVCQASLQPFRGPTRCYLLL